MYEYQRILQPSRSSENEQRISGDCRKSNKPLLEKKRRARINRSLDQLKTLLIDAIKNDHATGYSKLEKADILELAVKYLRNIRGQQISGESSVAARYRDGFSECAQEVDRFLASVSGLGHDTRYRLMNHLASCIKQPARRSAAVLSAHAPSPGVYGVQLPASSTGRAISTSESTVHDDINTPSFDRRRRPISVAALPYNSAVFPGFVAPPPMTGRLSACSLFPVVGDQPSAAAFSDVTTSFRPIQPMDSVDRCSPTDSEELGDDVTGGDAISDVDEDDHTLPSSAASRDLHSGRPLTEKNDNTDNIARGFLDAQKRDAAASDASVAAADQSMMMFMMMHNDVKDEEVWRPW